ncbi:MAG: hypothetical protein MJZ07_03385 [Bacteroidales bacterium]|nr:hypothetical protein [Bacteroidales bacterium]
MKRTILTILAAVATILSAGAQTISITGTTTLSSYGEEGTLTIKLSEKPGHPVVVGIAVDDCIKILEPTYVKGTAGLYLDWAPADWKKPKVIRYTFVNNTGKKDDIRSDREEINARMTLGVSSDDLKWRKSYPVELTLEARKGLRGGPKGTRVEQNNNGIKVTTPPTQNKKVKIGR